jgi:hypothetical protein
MKMQYFIRYDKDGLNPVLVTTNDPKLKLDGLKKIKNIKEYDKERELKEKEKKDKEKKEKDE